VRPGDVRRGAVVKLFPYGVFVKLDGGREGLLHKSKCGPGAKGKAHVPGKGDVVFVRVLEVKGDGRVAFSTLDVDPKTGRDRAARGKKRKSAPEPEPEPAAPADDAPAPADDDDDDEYDAGDGGDDDRGQLLSIGVDGLDDEPAAPKPAAKPAKKRPKYQAVEITVADESSSPTVRKIAWSKSKRDKPPPPPPAAPPPKKAKKASALAAPPEPKEFGVKSFAEIMAEKKKKQT
jgi:predicted RNA-binding protein with RPS1 domain